MTGPLTRAVRADRYTLLRKAVEALPENDRQILELRHFDDMSNADCAEVLHIGPKAASIRYVRALQRLRKQLMELTEFQPWISAVPAMFPIFRILPGRIRSLLPSCWLFFRL